MTDCVVCHIVLIAGTALAMFSVVLDYIGPIYITLELFRVAKVQDC